jgi:hypothetical protein
MKPADLKRSKATIYSSAALKVNHRQGKRSSYGYEKPLAVSRRSRFTVCATHGQREQQNQALTW